MPTWSTQDRLAAIEHVVHDYSELVSTGTIVTTDNLGEGLKPPLNTHVQTAFLTCCRKFFEFFTLAKNGDDVSAQHFVKANTSFSLPTWASWHEHMNKQLLHVTYTRNTNQRPWDGSANKDFLADFKETWTQMRTALVEPYKTKFEEEITKRLAACPEYQHLDLR